MEKIEKTEKILNIEEVKEANKAEKRVFVAECDSYEKANAAVNRVLDAFGGASAILGEGKRVLVKPNLLMPRKPEAAVTTHPAVIEAICAAFVKAGAEVFIIDSTGGPHTRLLLSLMYGATGIKKAAKNSGAKVLFDTSTKSVTYPQGRVLKESELISPAIDVDLVISAAKMKTHGFQTMSGCVKNLFGCIPGMDKPSLHKKFPEREEFAGMLVDVCQRVNPVFSILDGVYGMEGAGPASGDPKFVGAIIGGFSPYAVDLAQCRLMGLRVDSVYTLTEAASRGLAPIDPTELTWLGDDAERFRTGFKPAVEHKGDVVPTITDKCTGCGECHRICPMKCIKIEKHRAVIDEQCCIRCYCCHEFCPEKAILL